MYMARDLFVVGCRRKFAVCFWISRRQVLSMLRMM